MSTSGPEESPRYNWTDPEMPFCIEPDPGIHTFRPEALQALEDRRRSPYACELKELDETRDIARRLRLELIYGMPDDAEQYTEMEVPTSLNLPMFMEFIFEALTKKKDPGPTFE